MLSARLCARPASWELVRSVKTTAALRSTKQVPQDDASAVTKLGSVFAAVGITSASLETATPQRERPRLHS